MPSEEASSVLSLYLCAHSHTAVQTLFNFRQVCSGSQLQRLPHASNEQQTQMVAALMSNFSSSHAESQNGHQSCYWVGELGEPPVEKLMVSVVHLHSDVLA